MQLVKRHASEGDLIATGTHLLVSGRRARMETFCFCVAAGSAWVALSLQLAS